jgi:hypothetical protein
LSGKKKSKRIERGDKPFKRRKRYLVEDYYIEPNDIDQTDQIEEDLYSRYYEDEEDDPCNWSNYN